MSGGEQRPDRRRRRRADRAAAPRGDRRQFGGRDCGTVDPFPAAEEVAAKFSVPPHASLAELFGKDTPDGVILATPNQQHVDGGLECVAAGVPVLVEKPIGDSVESATRFVEEGRLAGTRGSLPVPAMRPKVYEGPRSWWESFTSTTAELERTDPPANQIDHFAAVIRGATQPICSGRERLKTLLVVDAVLESARTGRPVDLAP